jgi:hypothetical protein
VIRICFYGLTGSGKSTIARMLCESVRVRGQRAVILKLADPLYRLQREFYAVAGAPLEVGQQDQVLLESIARHLRRISPTSLADDFQARLERCGAEVVINEDLRDPDIDYPRLRALRFRFVRVTVDEAVRRTRLTSRHDLSTVVDSETTRRLELIVPDLELNNSGRDLEQLRTTVLPPVLELL